MNEIKYLWEDCSIGFRCPFCNEQLVAENEPLKCECGMIYSLKIELKLIAPEGKELKL